MKRYVTTKAQRAAIRALYLRSNDGAPSYLAFRRRFRYDYLNGVMFGGWCGMLVGIEADGFSHT